MYNTLMASTRIENLQEVILALADPIRLRLLSMMREQEVCVCYFTAVLDAPQPTVSRHLAYLRAKGLVKARREGKWMHYQLALPKDVAVAKVLEQVLEAASQDPQLQTDKKRLKAACCDPEKLVGIANAPR